MMTDMSLEPAIAGEVSDLRRVAIHEAAHAVVARSFGCVAKPIVYRNSDLDDGDERYSSWQGVCRFSRAAYQRDDYGAICERQISASEIRFASLAGRVADALQEDSSLDASELFRWMKEGVYSPEGSDAEGAGDFCAGDLDKTLAIVRKSWAEILTLADALEQEALTSQSQNPKEKIANFGAELALMIMARECRG